MDRRQLIKGIGAGSLLAWLPAAAAVPKDRCLVLVVLRGAMDGLAMVPPVGDPDYADLRGELALGAAGESNGVLAIDDLFGLHPAMPQLHRQYQQGNAILVHAVSSPYRERSHFDGQDVLEKGTTRGLRDGWLNRALGPLNSRIGAEAAIAMSQNTPLVLRGENSVTSWAPSRMPDASDSTIARLQDLYSNDEFFSTRLAQALDSREIAGDLSQSRVRQNELLQSSMTSVARFLTAEDGPRIAVVEAGGWDTHANQGTISGTLANRLGGLDDGLGALEKEMGSAWKNTVVAVVTEFGRTVRVNGTRGTDHGTATAAVLTGGAVDGGRVVCDWPGLRDKDLFEGRDLFPTTDIRSIFKAVLNQHLEIPNTYIENVVFPGSTRAPVTRDLIRT